MSSSMAIIFSNIPPLPPPPPPPTLHTSQSLSLAEEEALDIIDPLRHLSSTGDDDTDLLQAQSYSLYNQIIQIDIQIPLVHPETSNRTISLSLAVDASPGCGGIAWPAGEVLARYIARRGHALQGLNVLELGSGTGLVGLVAGYLGAHVCVTDQAPLIPIMNRNVSLNRLQSNVVVAELDWAKPLTDMQQRPDILLAADCVYFEPAFPHLVATLAALVRPFPERTPEVLFCYKKRRKADKRFFSLLKKYFTWSEV
ncbi:putative methyltransferase-domain-containing protein [Multifurca ochricompacta]|uniref:Methyltransferase-domain-containing protein n=1 Tax=Multifurca ochricompacta TaxID=376703 RepID=A0AAD4LVP6_9AGAM|nr:putative methyltransferase-domain-containing protein [Multifurca ochricompacta]